MSNNAPDYKDNLAFQPIGSQDDLNEQGRQSDVLIKAIEKCEKLEKENQQLKELLLECGKQLYEYSDVCLQEGYELEREEVLKLKTKIDNATGEKK